MPSLLDKIERVPVGTLITYPGNPRRGNLAAITESLEENQQYSPLVVQASTRYVLAGNHTLEAAQKLGWAEVDVVFVDVDDDRARKILISANRTADLGEYDDQAQLDILAQLDDLTGTGYADEDLDGLLQLSGILGQQASSFLDDIAGDAAGEIASLGNSTSPGRDQENTPQPHANPAPTSGNADETPPGSGPLPVTYVQMAWTVSPGDRDTVRQALRAAQESGGLDTQALALVAVARHYLESHP
jgi:hypothetical protein